MSTLAEGPIEACYLGRLELVGVCIQVCGFCCPRAEIVTAKERIPVGRGLLRLDQWADGREHLFCGFHYVRKGLCGMGECRFFSILKADDTSPTLPTYDPESGLLFLPEVEVDGDCYSALLRIPIERLPDLLLKAEKLPACPVH